MHSARVAHRLFVIVSLVLIAPVVRASSAADQAIFRATNKIRVAGSSVSLEHPRYHVVWTPESVHVAARRGPSWEWTLGGVHVGSTRLALVEHAAPIADRGQARVDYDRGAVIERYIYKRDTVEQQFVLRRQLSTDVRDLVIEGRVRSDGSFAATSRGWVWSARDGVISLGMLTVIDSMGNRLPSRMDVTADRVRLVVNGKALAHAAYPVTIDPEIGTNDFRISNVGTDGQTTPSAGSPNAAYDPGNNQFLVVWWQYDGTESEIYGQYIDAATGQESGSDFRISNMGSNVTPSALYSAYNPAIAFNSTSNEYLVVFQADDNNAPLINDEVEIFGRRITANGSPIGTDAFRISNMGTDGNASSGAASYGKVAWNSTNNEYLVVWVGTDGNGNGETEIRGQRLLGATGAETGAQLTFSTIGPTYPTAGYDSRGPTNAPDVAYDATDDQYLVVWAADAGSTDNENEIWGQRVTASTGAQVGSDFQISDMGPPGDQNYVAYNVAVAWNSVNDQYLVVWNGTDNTPPLVQYENEIFGRLINGTTGALIGSSEIRISNAWTDGDTTREALDPDVAYSATANEYLVAWRADASPTNDELEIWGQRIRNDGTEIGGDAQLSDMGPNGNTAYRPFSQQIATAGATFLVVWFSDDNTGSLVDDENEIFGQLFAASASMPSTMIDDFSVNQGPLTLGAIVGTVTDHNADNPAILGGERNLRISGANGSGDNITMQASGGALTFNRTSISNGEIALWWDGLNNTSTFDPNTSLPYDLTAGGTLDSFRITVNSASSASQQLRIYVYTTGTSVSNRNFTLPTGGGNVDLLFSSFTPPGSVPANFGAIRAIYISTLSNTGAFSASLDSIKVRSSTFGAPAVLTATATSTSAVGVTWTAVGGTSYYELWRSTLGSAYSLLSTPPGPSYNDSLLTANRTYLYKVRAISDGETSAYSPIDAATTIIFVDPTLSSSILVKAVHITQLRTAVNAMQQAAPQVPSAFSDPALAAGSVIRNYHVSELRTYLDGARAVIGLSPLGYVDPTINAQSTTMKAVHVTQLRAGTQ